MRDLSTMGKAFDSESLTLNQLHLNPFIQFELWLDMAIAHNIPEPNAMTLSTSDANNQPNARMVLLKKFNATGFVFFGHYDSQKAQELAVNPKASLLFYWGGMNRQVRLKGTVRKLDKKSSAAYFRARSLESQIAAILSPQSKILSEALKLALTKDYNQLLRKYQHTKQLPACPDYWGGFKFVPHQFEFWQGAAHRLHDRFVYEYNQSTKTWEIHQLAP